MEQPHYHWVKEYGACVLDTKAEGLNSSPKNDGNELHLNEPSLVSYAHVPQDKEHIQTEHRSNEQLLEVLQEYAGQDKDT